MTGQPDGHPIQCDEEVDFAFDVSSFGPVDIIGMLKDEPGDDELYSMDTDDDSVILLDGPLNGDDGDEKSDLEEFCGNEDEDVETEDAVPGAHCSSNAEASMDWAAQKQISDSGPVVQNLLIDNEETNGAVLVEIGYDSSSFEEVSYKDLHRKTEDLHRKTADLHRKMEDLHRKIEEGGYVSNSQQSNVNEAVNGVEQIETSSPNVSVAKIVNNYVHKKLRAVVNRQSLCETQIENTTPATVVSGMGSNNTRPKFWIASAESLCEKGNASSEQVVSGIVSNETAPKLWAAYELSLCQKVNASPKLSDGDSNEIVSKLGIASEESLCKRDNASPGQILADDDSSETDSKLWIASEESPCEADGTSPKKVVSGIESSETMRKWWAASFNRKSLCETHTVNTSPERVVTGIESNGTEPKLRAASAKRLSVEKENTSPRRIVLGMARNERALKFFSNSNRRSTFWETKLAQLPQSSSAHGLSIYEFSSDD